MKYVLQQIHSSFLHNRLVAVHKFSNCCSKPLAIKQFDNCNKRHMKITWRKIPQLHSFKLFYPRWCLKIAQHGYYNTYDGAATTYKRRKIQIRQKALSRFATDWWWPCVWVWLAGRRFPTTVTECRISVITENAVCNTMCAAARCRKLK